MVQVPAVGIGSAWGDYDNDGDLDVAICNNGRAELFYRNLGQGVFEVDTAAPTNRVGDTVESAAWGDYDNDGHLDLFLCRSANRNRLFHNRGDGTFEEVVASAPVVETGNYYNCAWGDYDNDGFLDLVTVQYHTDTAGTNNVYRNILREGGNTNRWLKVAPRGTVCNRAAIGATVRVKARIGGKTFWQRRQIASQTVTVELIAHFGLGDAANAEIVRIEWPSGQVTELRDVAANQILTVTESPLLTPVAGGPAGVFQLELKSHRGMAWELYASDHLHVSGETCACSNGYWKAHCCVTNTSGTVIVTDTNPPGTSARFYKAVAR